MIDLYARLLARCRSVNQVNRVHIALDERMIPLELQDLRRDMPPRSGAASAQILHSLSQRRGLVAKAVRRLRPDVVFRPESYAWLDGLGDWADRSGKPAPEPFIRRRVRANVVAFASGGPSAAKTLVVCFTGNARRLFLPIPVFLQHLDAERFDVLVLTDPSGHGYRNGLAGVAADFERLTDAIGGMFDRSAYGSVVTYGTSGGGLPAIVTALRLRLDKGVSVGGRGPLDPRWQSVSPGGVSELLRAPLRASGAATSLLFVHGADCEPDAEAARALAEIVPAETLAVRRRDGQQVGHNAVFPLLLESRLGAFLESALAPDAAAESETVPASGPPARRVSPIG